MVALLLMIGLVSGVPAHAADELLQITKSVDNAAPKPGESFSYTIQVICSEQDCLNAQLTDALPAELVGFPIQNVSFTPSNATVPHAVTWAPGNTNQTPTSVGPGTGLTVDFNQVTDDPPGTGLVNGQSFSVTITLQVPADYPPGEPVQIRNTARVGADNAATVEDSADIAIDAPVEIDVAVEKTWTPADDVFLPGKASTIGLSATNTSNVPVDQIVVQEPKSAPNGATTLDPSNPFTITDFTGFANFVAPSVCESVQVDAYVFSAGAWSWKSGTPAAMPASLELPQDVTNADVGGVRITCVGEIAPDAKMALDLGLAQRATHRDTGADLSRDSHTVNNVATGSVALQGQPPAASDDEASYTVKPLVPTVEAAKNISPARITAGQSANATISGTNGATPVVELRLADLGFFTEDVIFGGFSVAPTWPDAASAAEIVYHFLDGLAPASETVTFAEGDRPPPPSRPISGFEIVWTGPIAPSQTGDAKFTIDTTEDTPGTAPGVPLVNTVRADVKAENGATDDDSKSDALEITQPSIGVTLEKSVRPGTAVEPGDSVIASLTATATANGDGATVHDIVVQDLWAQDDCAGFWNAFNVTQIAPTQVPEDSTLTVRVQGADGAWHTLPVYGPEATVTTHHLDAAAFAAALAGVGLTPAEVQGVEFAFHNAPDGFGAVTTVTPNLVFEARADLRNPNCPPPAVDVETEYKNVAGVEADGTSAGGNPLNDDDDAEANGTVVIPEDGGNGPGPDVDVDKTWDKDFVNAQTAEAAGTSLRWNVTEGFASVTIADPATDPSLGSVAGSVYNAFDLTGLAPIDPSEEPYSNGWYLAYDTVTKVELFRNGSWQPVAAPGGSWMTSGRGFKGHQLTEDERDETTGVRITVQELPTDTAARLAAQQAGPAFDPFAPEPGRGVGYGSSNRAFKLNWEIRDTTRTPDHSFVTADDVYNMGAANKGTVNNTVAVEGTPIGGSTPDREVADDTIQIIDPPAEVAVSKSVDPTSGIFTPPVGTPDADYPKATWSIVGHNASVARASYVRLTDPATCTDTTIVDCQSAATPAGALADPFDTSANHLTNTATPNPFERFDATEITIGSTVAGQVDLDQTTVWLLRFSGGVYTTESMTATQANALGASDLKTVVGISVTFQGTDPAQSGGTLTQDNDLTITIVSQLRPTLRSSGAAQVLAASQTENVTNRVFAQSYDPVLNPDQVTGDIDDAVTELTGGTVNIAAEKSVVPGTITKPQHDAGNDQVTVTLKANQGSPPSSLSPQKVVIEDQADSPEFWNAFTFTGLGAVTRPAGADRVQVDLYDGSAWHAGTPSATATLPAGVANADVQGIRFTFTRADGKFFSATLPAALWAAGAVFTADLREQYRDSGDPMVFPSEVTNKQTSQSTRPDGNNSPVAAADAKVTLTPGTQKLAVNKLTDNGDRFASVGEEVPFRLTLKNTGTGYLTLTDLVDVLPPQLVFSGVNEPVYTAEPTGTLSEDVTLTPGTGNLTFTWPDGGRVMQPGETFIIDLTLLLEPGLASGQTATNTITATTEEALAACENTNGSGNLTGDWAADKHTCGTSDFVGTVTGANLFTIKGVRGSLPGAYRPSAPAVACLQNLNATDGAYFRSPCVANSQIGGTDDWVLRSANTGSVAVEEMTIFDQLPVVGDVPLITSGSRGSQYRPQVVGDSLKVTAPAGTVQTIQVTTSANVCGATWGGLATSPVCEQSGESWVAVDGATDWSKVSGVRIHLDFRQTADRALKSGQFADVTYSTTNQAMTVSDPSGASTVVEATDQLAWNQFGVKFRYAGNVTFNKIAPSKVGVHLRFGSLAVKKVVTGPAADYAADEFLVDVRCRLDSADADPDLDLELDLQDNATLALNAAGNYTARIDGIPLSEAGTVCTVTEQGPVGEFGETSRTGSPTDLTISQPTDPTAGEQAVPTAQIATITNDYRYTGLSVTKQVVTQATAPEFGPFRFTLSCLSATGRPVIFDGDATTIEFTLKAGATFDAPADRIPVGAKCVLTEVDSYHAGSIMITGDNVVNNGDGSAIITPGEETAQVVVTNGYDAGTVTVAKVVDGDGAATYGRGDFVFAVSCTFHGRTVFDEDITLKAAGTRTLGPFPVDTECSVRETGTGGANASVLDPASGIVTVAAPGDSEPVSNVTLTATNTFDIASVAVQKVVRGDLTAKGAQGTFTVELSCTWQVDGVTTDVAIPGGSVRVLKPRNDYRASYGNLPAAASCRIQELTDLPGVTTEIVTTLGGEKSSVDGRSARLNLADVKASGQANVKVINTFKHGGGVGGEENKPGTNIPNTGAPIGWRLIPFGLLLILAGLGAVWWSRRERTA